MVVHLGVVLIAVALAASQSYATEREVTLARGRVGGGRRPHRSSSSATRSTWTTAAHRGPTAAGPHRRRAGLRAGDLSGSRTAAQTHRHAVGAHRASPRTCTCRSARHRLRGRRGRRCGSSSQPLVLWLWIGGGAHVRRHVPGRVPRPARATRSTRRRRRCRRAEPAAPVGAPSRRRSSSVPDDVDDAERRRRRGAGAAAGRPPCSSPVLVVRRRHRLRRRRARHPRAGRQPHRRQPARRPAGAGRSTGTTLDGDTFDLADRAGPVRRSSTSSPRGACRASRSTPTSSRFDERHRAHRRRRRRERRVRRRAPTTPAASSRRTAASWPVIVGDDGDIALDYGVARRARVVPRRPRRP